MKRYVLMLALIFLPVPAFSQYYGEQSYCSYSRRVFDSYGNYIRSETYYSPCQTYRPYVQQQNYNQYGYGYGYGYNNRQVYCDPSRTIIGGLLGTAVGGALSRGNGRYWAMPLGGAIGGAAIGCGGY